MTKILNLFFDFLLYSHYKRLSTISERGREKGLNNILYLLSIVLSLNLLNLFSFIPLFINKTPFPFLYLILINIIYVAGLSTIFFIDLRNMERVNNGFIKKSEARTNFINYLTNDLFFNLKFSAILSVIILFYIFLLYFPLLFILKLTFLRFLIIVSILFLSFTVIIFLVNILIYLLNRDIERSFFEFHNDKNPDKLKFLFIFFSFSIFFILSSFICNLFVKNFLVVSGVSLGLTILLTFLLNIILDKLRFYEGRRVALLSDKFNKLFFITNDIRVKYNLFNYLKSIRFIYLFLILIGYTIFILILNRFLNLNGKIVLFQIMLFPMFFVRPLLATDNIMDKAFKRAYLFTVSLFAVIFAMTFLKTIDFSFVYKNGFFSFIKDFINPFFDVYNNFCKGLDKFYNSVFIMFYLFTPLLFLSLFFAVRIFYHFKLKVEVFFDMRLKKKLNTRNASLIFGDSMSLYYFLFNLFLNLILIFILNIELVPVSKFFFGLFDTFQVAQVFKLTFLTYDNILLFFKTIVVFLSLFLILKLTLSFVSSCLSHFMLFSNEIVYYENKIYKTTVLRLPISRVNYIVVKQNLFEKLFDIGSIYIETQDKNGVIKIGGISSIRDKNIKIVERMKFDIQKI